MGEGAATKHAIRRRRIIERPRLTTLLDESQGRIKMLVAPAGYGKTTLARQWLEDREALHVVHGNVCVHRRRCVGRRAIGSGVACGSRSWRRVNGATLRDQPTGGRGQDSGGHARPRSVRVAERQLVLDDYHEASRSFAAELLIEHLLKDAPLNEILIVSRQRPRWRVQSRRMLYGRSSPGRSKRARDERRRGGRHAR